MSNTYRAPEGVNWATDTGLLKTGIRDTGPRRTDTQALKLGYQHGPRNWDTANLKLGYCILTPLFRGPTYPKH